MRTALSWWTLAVLVGSMGCAGIDFKDATKPETNGIRYYKPASYILVTPDYDKGIAKIAYFAGPDTSRLYAADPVVTALQSVEEKRLDIEKAALEQRAEKAKEQPSSKFAVGEEATNVVYFYRIEGDHLVGEGTPQAPLTFSNSQLHSDGGNTTPYLVITPDSDPMRLLIQHSDAEKKLGRNDIETAMFADKDGTRLTDADTKNLRKDMTVKDGRLTIPIKALYCHKVENVNIASLASLRGDVARLVTGSPEQCH